MRAYRTVSTIAMSRVATRDPAAAAGACDRDRQLLSRLVSPRLVLYVLAHSLGRFALLWCGYPTTRRLRSCMCLLDRFAMVFCLCSRHRFASIMESILEIAGITSERKQYFLFHLLNLANCLDFRSLTAIRSYFVFCRSGAGFMMAVYFRENTSGNC